MSAKNIVIIILVALFVLFVVQNTRTVDVQLLFWTVSMSRALMLLGTLLIGLIAGWLLGRTKRKNIKSRV
jgi:putative membrane protein